MSRALTIWNDETIKLVKDKFVAVSVPTWVCRSAGPEGEFLRRAGIDKQWVTSSGYMHCVSASGRLLGGRPSAKVLEAFLALPESERRPGAVEVPDISESQRAILSPPKDGLVLRVHARFLARDDKGGFRYAGAEDFPLMQKNPGLARRRMFFLQPNTEYMWLTGEERRSLIPDEPTNGARFKIASDIIERLARFHLTPQRALTSEGGIINKRLVKSARAALVVQDVSPTRIRMRLEGFVHWGSDYDESKATTPNGLLSQGFETPLYGRVEYDREKKAFVRFDMVAPGDVWGRWGDANGSSMTVERPQRNPIGFALELATGDSPSDRIPPGGNSHYVTERDYFAKRRQTQ